MDNRVILHTPSVEKYHKLLTEGVITENDYWQYIGSLYYKDVRLTLVGIPNLEENTLSIGLAICSYPDNFSKKIGVELATKRATIEPVTWKVQYNKDVRPEWDVSSTKFCLSQLQEYHADVASDINKYKRILGNDVKV